MFSGIGVLPVLLCPGCSPAFPRCSRTQGVPEVFPRCSRCRGVFKVFPFNVSPFPRRSQCGNTVLQCTCSTSARSQGVPNAFPCPRRSHGVPKAFSMRSRDPVPVFSTHGVPKVCPCPRRSRRSHAQGIPTAFAPSRLHSAGRVLVLVFVLHRGAVTVSSTGVYTSFKEMTTATSGVIARFPLLLPVRNSVASYGASAVARTPGRGHVAEVKKPMSSGWRGLNPGFQRNLYPP